jgi:mono/diheme cytochrome c family protein
MKYALLVSCILAMACAAKTTTPSTPAVAERLVAIKALTGNATAGALVYNTTATPACVSCHQADGKSMKDLAEPSKADAVEELAGYILSGIGSAMPAQKTLSNQQVADVVAYIKATFGK